MAKYDQWPNMTMFGVLDMRLKFTLRNYKLTGLWLLDTQFSQAGTQCATVESKDFSGPVFAAHLPLGLFKYPNNVVALNLLKRFLRRC